MPSLFHPYSGRGEIKGKQDRAQLLQPTSAKLREERHVYREPALGKSKLRRSGMGD